MAQAETRTTINQGDLTGRRQGAFQEIFSIRDLTKECGVTARTLRFYE